jgi:hypothetical protein
MWVETCSCLTWTGYLKLPLRCKWGFVCWVNLYNIYCEVVTDVLGQSVGLLEDGMLRSVYWWYSQTFGDSLSVSLEDGMLCSVYWWYSQTFGDSLSVSLEGGTNRLSRNIGKYQSQEWKFPQEQRTWYIFTEATVKIVWTVILLWTTSCFLVFILVNWFKSLP